MSLNPAAPDAAPIHLDPIEDALAALAKGEMVIVVDDENRENEGDLVMAAEHATPQAINFMTIHGRGLVCVPLTDDRCTQLGLRVIEGNQNDRYGTAFTDSVDYLGGGNTTGISAQDRARTIEALLDEGKTLKDFMVPGHIFPLRARPDGVLRRAGHTEAAVDLARLAGCKPAGVIVEILNEDGTMARLPQLRQMADRHGLKLISIEDLITYRLQHERLVDPSEPVQMPTRHGTFRLVAYSHRTTAETHLALVKGEWAPDEPVLVRVHSSCLTGDVFGSCRCDCGEQLEAAMRQVEAEGKGVILYMNQEGRGIGLLNKLKAYRLQEEGLDTVEANEKLGFKMDQREYGTGAQMLRHLGVRKMRLLTNNPKKRAGLLGYGLEVVDVVPLQIAPNPHNARYLDTKRTKMGHVLPEALLPVAPATGAGPQPERPEGSAPLG